MKKMLMTGASGFVGSNITPLLIENYSIDTIGLDKDSTFFFDFSSAVPSLISKKYDVVLHVAGKAHVDPRNEKDIQAFFSVNYDGTINLCKALEQIGPPVSFIFISTVAVYGLDEGEDISESEPLDGITPYARSKILAEEFLTKWCQENNVKLTILRPSLLAGKNPPGNLKDMINGIRNKRYLSIAGGKARKSIAMVTDLARLIPLCENVGGIYNVCDSINPSFRELEKVICDQFKVKLPLSIPYFFAFFIAKIGDLLGSSSPINSKKLKKITSNLTFSNAKIITDLKFEPSDVLSNFKI